MLKKQDREKAAEEAAEAVPVPEEAGEEAAEGTEVLADKNVPELKDIAREEEIAGFSSMRKDELVTAIEGAEVERASTVPASVQQSMTDRAQQQMNQGIEIGREQRAASVAHNQELRDQHQKALAGDKPAVDEEEADGSVDD